MKKLTTKLAVALLALSCASVCIGTGVAVQKASSQTNITAKAESISYTVNSLTFTSGDASAFNAYPNDGSNKPSGSGWDHVYTLQSGEGVKLNGEKIDGYAIKFPHDFYIEVKVGVNEGDILTFDGTFYNAEKDTYFVFNNCSLKFNGSGWESYTAPAEPVGPEVYDIGELTLHVNSTVGGASGANNALYLTRVDEEALPVKSWEDAFVAEDSSYFKINGEAATLNGCKSTGDGFYWEFNALNPGDVVTIGGTFYCESQNTKYVIAESHFRWTGSGWEKYTPPAEPVGPEVYDIGELTLHVNSTVGGASGANNALYLTRVDEEALPILSWEDAFVAEDSSYFKINGEAATLNGCKSTGDGFYWEFNALNPGDVVTIGGTFYCVSQNTKYIIAESHFRWTGSGWEKATIVNYATYETGKVAITGSSNASAVYFYKVDESGFEVTEGTWTEKLSFLAGSGIGITLNGAQINMGDIKIPGDIYVGLGLTAQTGDILAIGGTFYNDNLAVKYVIEECEFQWNGTAWVEYVEAPDAPEIQKFNVGELIFGSCGTSNNQVYFKRADGEAFTIISTENDVNWTTPFSWKDGVGVTLNGEAITPVVKFPGDMFVELPAEPSEGDRLVIGGTFYSETLAVEYVIAETEFEWSGTAWKVYAEPVEIVVHDIGALELHINSKVGGAKGDNSVLYLQRVDGEALPVTSWDHFFFAEDNSYFKINGETATLKECKSTGDGFYWKFNALNAGDVITIGGTFYCETLNVKYVIAESQLTWNGSGWEKYVEYTNYDVGMLLIVPDASSTSMVYFMRADGGGFEVMSWDYAYSFRAGSGNGLTLNGEPMTTKDIKFPPNDMYIGLGIAPKEGDVITIGGTFYSPEMATSYTISESSFVFDGAKWQNKIDIVKADAKAALEEYKATFSQDNYYEAEWNSFTTIAEAAYANIDAAATEAEVQAIVDEAKVAMDNVVTKAESDAIFEELKVSAQDDIAAYKSESDYRAAEWATIQEIVADAKAAIANSTSVTEINTVVSAAKAEMDALKTNAQWEADEAVVAAAKAELDAYKTEDAYAEVDWAAMQTIISEAKANIDEAIGDAEAISAIVADAKLAMDSVWTSDVREANEAVVAAAAAELDAYKTEGDYKAAEWAAIQTIISEAKADIDEAIGDAEAISAIVAAAKADIDKVKTATQVDAEAFAALQASAKDEVRAYYNAIDHSLYSDEAEEAISGYVAAAMDAIDNAKTAEEIETAVAQFKANVEAVEKVASSNDSSNDDAKSKMDCSAVIGSGLATSGTALAFAVVTMLRKKKED